MTRIAEISATFSAIAGTAFSKTTIPKITQVRHKAEIRILASFTRQACPCELDIRKSNSHLFPFYSSAEEACCGMRSFKKLAIKKDMPTNNEAEKTIGQDRPTVTAIVFLALRINANKQ
jgi:hypothetical protein